MEPVMNASTVTLAFYKGEGYLLDKAIRWWTNSSYSHVAIIIDGTCFEADAWKGWVVSRSWGLYYNTANWDLVNVDADKEKVWSFLLDNIGKRYDYPGVVGFLLPWRPQVQSWRYCSELTAAALGHEKTKVSPGDLAEIFLNKR